MPVSRFSPPLSKVGRGELSVLMPMPDVSTDPLPLTWTSSGTRLEVVRYKDFHPADAGITILGCLYGSSRFYNLPQDRSQLLKDSKCPASIPTGRAMRDWLNAHCPPVQPDAPEVSPTESTKTVI